MDENLHLLALGRRCVGSRPGRPGLMKNWASLQGDLEKAAPDLARRFAEICDSHTDYIWQNKK